MRPVPSAPLAEMSRRRAPALWLLVALLLGACTKPIPPPAALPVTSSIDVEVYRRAESERAQRLQREVDRLRDDLRQAEEALVAAESGLRGHHTRAAAVSSLAEARIQVERSARIAPWRSEVIREAHLKLDEADRQIREGHFGAALFFVYRARRIGQMLTAEAQQVNRTPGARFVAGRRVNLRSGPSPEEPVLTVLTRGTPVFPEGSEAEWVLVRSASGPVGWVHGSLLHSK